MKHGLTMLEAKRYTDLNFKFYPKNLSKAKQAMIENDFECQIFAFRKLRDKMIMNDKIADLYHKNLPKPPPSPNNLARKKQN